MKVYKSHSVDDSMWVRFSMLCNLFTVSRYQSDHVSFVHWMGTEILLTGRYLALDSSFKAARPTFIFKIMYILQKKSTNFLHWGILSYNVLQIKQRSSLVGKTDREGDSNTPPPIFVYFMVNIQGNMSQKTRFRVNFFKAKNMKSLWRTLPHISNIVWWWLLQFLGE